MKTREEMPMFSRRTLLAAPPALALASAAGAATGGLRWDSHYLMMRIIVNGKPVDALLDFNAKGTLLDRRHAAMLGAPTGDGLTIDAAGRRLGPLRAAVTDLADYANFLLHGRIGMILGRDLFAAGPWLLATGAPSLEAVDRPRAHQGTALPLSDRFGSATIPVSVNGVAAQATLMFRDLDTALVSAAFAARTGLARPRGTAAVRGMRMMGAAVGIDRLDVAGTRISDINVALDGGDRGPDLWLGAAILQRFRIGIDLAAGNLWFASA
jgi:predicted aspartyl protease